VFSPTLKKLGVQHPSRSPIRESTASTSIDGQRQPTGNSNLKIDPEQNSIALYQASRYSQYCRVFARCTGSSRSPGSARASDHQAQRRARAVGRPQLLPDLPEEVQPGRGFVFISHSQGSFVLRQLIAKDVDPSPPSAS